MRWRPCALMLCFVALSLGAPPSAPACVGDCSGNGVVSVDELVKGVTIALGAAVVGDCTAMDDNEDRTVTVDELVAAVAAALNGCPPTPSPTPTETPTVTTTPTPTINQPPVLAPLPVYRTYPEYPIHVPIAASDPENGVLQYASDLLPDGATLGSASGVFEWQPNPQQLGPFVIPVVVSDDGIPPASASADFPIVVSPLDACTIPTCDPALGCTHRVVPVDTPCCGAPPQVRFAEPAASCPGGRVLFVGRNQFRGFGRIQNCDRMEMGTLGQGGHHVRFNVEVRCVNAPERITIVSRMTTRGAVLFDQTNSLVFTSRDDGFAQRLGLLYLLPGSIRVESLEGAEANLTVTIADVDGVALQETVRVVLTQQALPDLPDL